MKNKILPVVLFLLTVSGAAIAQSEAYTLEAAVAYALEHNPDLLAVREQANAAGARTRVAAGARLPELGVSYRVRASNNPLDAFADKLNTRSVTAPDFAPDRLNNPGTSDLYAAQLSLRLPVYAGGKLSADLANAEALERNARLQYERAREATAYRTTQAYLNVQAAERGLEIADDAVEAAREHATITARLVREGRIVLSDNLTAQVNLAGYRGMREQAANRLEQVRDRLKLAMGLAMSIDVTIARGPAWGTEPSLEIEELADVERIALARRRDLQGLRALYEAARARVDAARSSRKPAVDLVASSDWYDDQPGLDNRSWSVMGVVRANLYAGGRYRGEIAAAQYELRALELRVRAKEQGVRNEARGAYHNLREARARLAIARGNVDRARETVRLVDRRYGQGRTILIDLLQAERALVEARKERLDSALNLQTGLAALRLAEGVLDFPGRSED